MNTAIRILLLGKNRVRGFLLVALLVSLGTATTLIEPWIYRAIIDDIAGVFVQSEPFIKVEGFISSTGSSLEHLEGSARRFFHAPLKPEQPGPKHRILHARSINQAFATVLLGAFFILLFRAIAQGLNMAGDNLSARLSNEIERNYILKTFKHVLRLPISFFNSRPSGTIAHQIDQSDQIAPIFSAFSQEVWPELFTLISIFVILFAVNWELAIIVLLVVPIYALVTWRMSSRLDSALERYYELWDSVSGKIQQAIAGIKTIQSQGTAAYESKKLEVSADNAYSTYLKRNRIQNFYSYLQDLLVSVSKACVLAFGGLKALQHQLTPGDVVLFITYVDRVYDPIKGLTALLTSLQQNMGSVRRAQKLLLQEVSPGEDRSAFLPGKGEIIFDNVTFSYNHGGRKILDGISFKINPSEKVALVGPSGAGKTTLSDLLMALYKPVSGEVFIDGQSLSKVRPSSVRACIRGVAAEGMLFQDSILENIRYGRPEATEAEVLEAAEFAGLVPVIARLHGGLNTLVGERGVELSLGERQRILLARAFLSKPLILILDEATANLDFKTEEHIKNAIDNLSLHRTSLIIAHRKSMLTNIDRILVLNEGHIEQDGKPEDLIKAEGYFRQMMMSGNAPND
jgi:ATP-binding cassette subfamily B protein